MSIAMSLAACAPGKRVSERVRITANDSMDAEQLALAGEQLMSPYTFHLADKSFEMALAKDPDNQRAQLYRALLKPLMATKGLATRIRPLVREHGDIARYDRTFKELPNAPMKDFLTTNPEDIKTADQAMDAAVAVRNGFIEMYEFLKKNQDLNMVVHLNPHIFERSILRSKNESCRILQDETGRDGAGSRLPDTGTDTDAGANAAGFTVECDFTEVATRKLTPADMIALRQVAAGYILYLTMYSSYNVTGIEDVIKEDRELRRRNSGVGLTPQRIFERLEQLPYFGTIRKDNSMALLRTLGADFSVAWKWAMKNQSRLCPATQYPTDRRRRGYVFEDGICVRADDQSRGNLARLEQALEGAVNTNVHPHAENEAVRIDPFALARKPITNLKDVFPSAYATCNAREGVVAGLKDPTFGGLFPDGDARRLLRCSR